MCIDRFRSSRLVICVWCMYKYKRVNLLHLINHHHHQTGWPIISNNIFTTLVKSRAISHQTFAYSSSIHFKLLLSSAHHLHMAHVITTLLLHTTSSRSNTFRFLPPLFISQLTRACPHLYQRSWIS